MRRESGAALAPMSQFRASFLMGKRRTMDGRGECHARRARRQSDRSEAEQSQSFVPSLSLPSSFFPPSAKPKANFENAKRAGVIQ